MEYLAITICSNLTKFNICVVYRPPDHTCLKFLESLDTLLNELRFLKGTLIIVGDFHIDIFSNDHGHDGLSNKMVKLCAPVIMKLMVVCFNEMFTEETFPDICKIAKVIALFKSGSDIDFTNHRSISLLSTISEIFEKNLFTNE